MPALIPLQSIVATTFVLPSGAPRGFRKCSAPQLRPPFWHLLPNRFGRVSPHCGCQFRLTVPIVNDDLQLCDKMSMRRACERASDRPTARSKRNHRISDASTCISSK
jgi:hypothetical protein